MPAKSKKQEKFMQAVANNPAFAKKVGVPQSVGKEFTMKKGMADKAGRAMHKQGADAMGRAMKKAAMGGPLVNRQPKEKKYAMGGKVGGGPSTPGKPSTIPGKPMPGRPTPPPVKKAKGGQLSKADGVAKKGKTHTKHVAMKKGGYMKGGSC